MISSYSYQYDSAGNPTKMTEANGDYTDYGYDNIYQLASEVMKDSGGTTIYSISWTYDNVGNRATQTKDGNQTSYTYNNMNQMTAAGNTTFTYDSNGNTASKTESQNTTNYTWHYENRLTKIDNPSGDDYVYEYDGDGMRVRSGHDSGQANLWDTRFYYDTGAPLYSYVFESDDAKNMTVAYTVGPNGNLISQRRSGSTYYHLYDQLGSTRKLLDSNQATTDSYSYYAFGDVRASSGSTPNPFKFVGQLGYYDDPSTDFQYLRARYYAPACGDFWSVDPVRRGAREYAYAGGRPLLWEDPSGLCEDRHCWPSQPPSWGVGACLADSRKRLDTIVAKRGDWEGWYVKDAACPKVGLYGYMLVCYWWNKKAIGGWRGYCQWFQCYDFWGCPTFRYEACGPYIWFDDYLYKRHTDKWQGWCDPEKDSEADLIAKCEQFGPPGGWPRLQ